MGTKIPTYPPENASSKQNLEWAKRRNPRMGSELLSPIHHEITAMNKKSDAVLREIYRKLAKAKAVAKDPAHGTPKGAGPNRKLRQIAHNKTQVARKIGRAKK